MRFAWAIPLLVTLPVVTSFVTYAIVIGKNNPIVLDSTQAAIMCLVMIKMVFLGGLRVFPVNLNTLFSQVTRGGEDTIDQLAAEDTIDELAAEDTDERPRRDLEFFSSTRNEIFKTPTVDIMPCTRRLLCQIETAIRTSETYGEQASNNTEGRHLEEEVSPEVLDPLAEMYTEALRALFGYEGPDSPDTTPEVDGALAAALGLTGKSCERAYTLCTGRYTASEAFHKVFDEISFRAIDEL